MPGLRVLLAAMPWTDYDKPSIQVAVLKRYLESHGFDRVEGAYFYAEIAAAIGFHEYHGLAYPWYLDAEPLYSFLMFPEMRGELLANERLRARVAEAVEGGRAAVREHYPRIALSWSPEFFERFEALHQAILDRYDWTRFDLVGFTLNYGQTVASLYMAREIKRRNPRCAIVFGGVDASGSLGRSLLECFDFVDYCCNGEGEKPLLELARGLEEPGVDLSEIRGITARRGGEVVVNPPHRLESLRDLETPDFDEYFAALRACALEPLSVVHSLPIEGSRGCPYECSFCGVPLSWGTSFRCRTADEVAGSMRALAKRYGVLSFLFVDNITPSNPNRLFSRIAEDGVDYRMFFELRANLPLRTLRLMKSAGVTNVQIGVEALSTSLLAKFNKRTRAITNVAAMKHCEALGIYTGNNLIVGHPLTTEEEIDETIANMSFCRGFFPPAGLSNYTLQVGSRDYEHNRAALGCTETRNSEDYRSVYPPHLFERLDLLWKDATYAAPVADWSRIEGPLAAWTENYLRMRKELVDRPILSWVDGGDFLVIDDYRSGQLERYVLDERQREIYLFVDERIRSLAACVERFGLPEGELRETLSALVDLELVFAEGDDFIGLAIRQRADRRFSSLDARAGEAARVAPAAEQGPRSPAKRRMPVVAE